MGVEFAGALEPGPYSHLASSPEYFMILARSSGEARKLASQTWAEKYSSSPGLITSITVAAVE